jgi:hypothetical protein
VVVDHLGDFRLLYAIDGLGIFIVVHQSEADARWIDEVRLRDDTHHFPSRQL